ncbi:hypothetical protein AcW1_006846 [Taiwanofungus camphoratus]|nr:hypothetical protein AcW1_006846 [Antrodia cinnamomea]
MLGEKAVAVFPLLDSGADANLVHPNFVKKWGLPTRPLPRTVISTTIDGSANRGGPITHRVEGSICLQGNDVPTNFYVSDIGPLDVVLDNPWLAQVNPKIDWEKGTIDINEARLAEWQGYYAWIMAKPTTNGIPLCRASIHEDDDELEQIVCTYTWGEGVLDVFQDASEPLVDKEGLLRTPKYHQSKLNWGSPVNSSKRFIATARQTSTPLTPPDQELRIKDMVPGYLLDYKDRFEKAAAKRFPEP